MQFDNWGRPIQPQIPEGYKLVKDPNYNPWNRFNQPNQPPQDEMTYLPGGYVNSVNDIKPNQVPRDGSIALFMRNDGLEIYAKQVNRNGYINELVFVPKQPDPPPEQAAQNVTQATDLSHVNERLEKIEGMITELKSLWDSPAQTAETVKNDAK